jgi:hypothetical protein
MPGEGEVANEQQIPPDEINVIHFASPGRDDEINVILSDAG